MKGLALSLLLALSFCDWFNPSTTNIQDNRNGGNPVGGSSLCEGLVASINVDSESGSSVQVGRTITFSADPRDSAGNSVPAECKAGPVSASPIGECVPASNLPVSLESIELMANAVGECKARVEFAGKVGTSEAVEITP
jgi:hypothetical protein